MKIRNTPMLIGLAAVLIAGTVACSQGPADSGTAAATAAAEDGLSLTEQSIQQYYDELDYQRAVQTYLWSIPAMYMYSLRQSLSETFGATPSNIPVWEDLMDNETVLLTPNSQVVYTFHFLDLKTDGPTVLQTAPGKLAALLDSMWDQPITDIGATGPDKGKGGKYLILPPDFEGEAPDGYFIFTSRTYDVFVFWRAFIEDEDTSVPVALMEKTRIYPLRSQDDPPEMVFPNGTGQPADMLYPMDYSYFEGLADFVQREHVGPEDWSMRGMMASLGIVKGQPFAPDERMKRILAAGAEVGTQAPRPAPGALPPLPGGAPDGLALERLALLPSVPWDQGLTQAWTPGEAQAWYNRAAVRLTQGDRDGAIGDYSRAIEADRAWLATLARHLADEGVLVMNFVSTRTLLEANRIMQQSLPTRFARAFRLSLSGYENAVGAFVSEPVAARQLRQTLRTTPVLGRGNLSRLPYRIQCISP